MNSAANQTGAGADGQSKPIASSAPASRGTRTYEDCEREAIQIEAQFTTKQLEQIAESQWQAGRRKQQGVLGRGSPLAAERQRNSGGNIR